MDTTIFVILLYVLVGCLLIILGLPLLLEKIKPNWLYGFRLPKTMSNKEIWYKSNKYVGRDLIIAGVIVIIGSIFLLIFRSIFPLEIIVFTGSFLIIIPIVAVLFRGLSYLKKL